MAAKTRAEKKSFSTSKYYKVVRTLPDKPGICDGYHGSCYSNFTAVRADNVSAQPEVTDSGATPPRLRSTCGSSPSTSTSVFFAKRCIFCDSNRRNRGSNLEKLSACETESAERSIKEAANALHDDIMLAKTAGIDFVAKEVKYHHSCKSLYLKSAGRVNNPCLKSPSTGIEIAQICTYVEHSVITNNRPELLTSVHARYVDMCDETGVSPITSGQYLMKVLQKTFQGRLVIQTPQGKKAGVILCSSSSADGGMVLFASHMTLHQQQKEQLRKPHYF